MKLLKNKRWKQHPWSKTGYVHEVEIKFLSSIANPYSTNSTDLLNGEIVHQDKVWENIEKEGMQEPILVVIGYKNKTIRLEAGNHRIKTALKIGYTHLPAAFLVFSQNLYSERNGKHCFDAENIIDFSKLMNCPYPYQIDPKEIMNNKLFI